MFNKFNRIIIPLCTTKNIYTSFFVDCFEINAELKNIPSESDVNNAAKTKDFTDKIYLSKNHIFGNLFTALMIKQYPSEQIKLPAKKK